MNRSELLEHAAIKLTEAGLLLVEAGERRLAADADELADIVEFTALPFEQKQPPSPTRH